MIEKLKILKRRAEDLNYKNNSDLDDIIRKTKLYLQEIFPNKKDYLHEVDNIKYTPLYSFSDISFHKDAWQEGVKKLVNFIDTRIEEYHIVISNKKMKQNSPIIKEKILKIEDTYKINHLNYELEKCQKKNRLWLKIDWAKVLTIGLAILGGTFLFGKYIGENRFDQKKIDLSNENENFSKENNQLRKTITILKSNIDLLKKQL